MWKGYINLSRDLGQNFEKMGLTEQEFCFMIKILSHKEGYLLNDEILNYKEDKARRLRTALKEKGLIKCFTTKGVGTKYYIQWDNWDILQGFEPIKNRNLLSMNELKLMMKARIKLSKEAFDELNNTPIELLKEGLSEKVRNMKSKEYIK